jgi:RHS repeat-associated protein
MRQDVPGANPQGKTPFEKDIYFYHPDHLGSSNYITDTNGKLYEHLEYFPFGEAWVEENSNTQRTPYLFTAKELDEETGLYYYGARYYDPRTSVWQSADAILDRYLPTDEASRHLPGFGGVYNSRNLGLYSYAHLNPVTYHDPDGNFVKLLVTVVKIGIKGGDIYSTVSGVVDNAKILMDPNASAAEKLMAAADIALDVGTGINTRDIKAAAKVVENVKDRVQAARNANKARLCSFAAGTLVMTKEGLKPIEEIKAGDYVLARNDLTGEQSWRRVVLAYNSLHNDILSLNLADAQSGKAENIVTTSEHPFYIQGQGWVRADQLKIGDLIETANATVVRVASIEWLKTEQLAYNMEVEEFHTYFVGQKQVWVHNVCDPKNALSRDKSGRVHTKAGENELPGPKEVKKMNEQELRDNIGELKGSVKARKEDIKRHGADPTDPKHKPHADRLRQEEESLRLHEKRLEDIVGKKNVPE